MVGRGLAQRWERAASVPSSEIRAQAPLHGRAPIAPVGFLDSYLNRMLSLKPQTQSVQTDGGAERASLERWEFSPPVPTRCGVDVGRQAGGLRDTHEHRCFLFSLDLHYHCSLPFPAQPAQPVWLLLLGRADHYTN